MKYIKSDWKWLSIMGIVDFSLFFIGITFMKYPMVPIVICVLVLFFNIFWLRVEI